ncbi:Dyp-type peroxidase [Rarobacter incanus]|uniref:Dye decolorizing peroxidase n=1 Tax=Rarobacter incanus TaxID=153494 RepID=A0A542SQM2_9MICO|nr:Dyp-type peroxidase [Rarobacter incanus]TQK76909.1 dye decolorizing peroxidase [Rarobacter incanus]
MTDGRPQRAISRRGLLGAGAMAGIGAAAAVGLQWRAQDRRGAPAAPSKSTDAAFADSRIAFAGAHQAGLTVDAQAYVRFAAFDLIAGADRDAVRRLMRTLTDDASALMDGRAPLGDQEPEMAYAPANLTVTVGVGPALMSLAAGKAAVPSWLAPLPAFGVDDLREEWSGGDLLVEVASDEPATVMHAARQIAKDIRSIASPRWVQDGFRNARGAFASGTTMRNLFGQVDGTVNPVPGTAAFDAAVWISDGPLAGGTSLVLRRIRMDLDAWDRIDRTGREGSVGRFLSNGAPLTGVNEHDEPDFEAVDNLGFAIIPDYAHMRRARGGNSSPKIYRRGANYEIPARAGQTEAGLIFASYQADPVAQYVPIQRRLDELDMLNEWTTPIGSAVFAMLPGAREGERLGAALFN